MKPHLTAASKLATSPSAAETTQRRKRGLSILFLTLGVLMGSVLTRTPAIRDAIGASTSEMGLILFGASTGAMVGIVLSRPLVTRWGSKPVMIIGATSALLCMPTIAAASSASPPVDGQLLTAGGLFLFGLGFGVAEVAVTLEATEVENTTQRPFLPTMHGFFSLGACLGAVTAMVCAATQVGVGRHLMAVGTLALLSNAAALRAVPSLTTRVASGSGDPGPQVERQPWTVDAQLVIIGLIVFAMALAEGTANDWMPLIMVDGHGLDAAYGSMVYAAFSGTVAVGRFAGSRLVYRAGPANFLIGTGALAAAGIALVATVDNLAVVSVGVLMWGVGVASGFPLALSIAGRSGPNATARISFAATVGYLALLTGPPVLGFVGEHLGLRAALVVPMLLMILVVLIAGRIDSGKVKLAASDRI